MSEESSSKVALVTGGGTGIGAACCKALADAGYKVAIHYNSSASKAQALADEIAGAGGQAVIVQANLSEVEGSDALYTFVKKELGGGIDVLVNNAGIVFDNPIFSASVEEFEQTINTNLRTTFYLSKRIARFMIRKRAGRIINISSVVASLANPTQAIYSMSKAAIESFTRVAAIEFAEYNILVNAVAPGFIQTSMTEKIPEEFQAKIKERIPLQRMGSPEEIAETVRFLAESGSYITGTVVHVNGGLYV